MRRAGLVLMAAALLSAMVVEGRDLGEVGEPSKEICGLCGCGDVSCVCDIIPNDLSFDERTGTYSLSGTGLSGYTGGPICKKYHTFGGAGGTYSFEATFECNLDCPQTAVAYVPGEVVINHVPIIVPSPAREIDLGEMGGASEQMQDLVVPLRYQFLQTVDEGDRTLMASWLPWGDVPARETGATVHNFTS